MNEQIEQIKSYFERGVADSSRMINVRLFRRKVNKTWEWVIDADMMNEQGDAIIDTARAVQSLTPICGICKKLMIKEEDCGGDCIQCMADSGDHQAIEALEQKPPTTLEGLI